MLSPRTEDQEGSAPALEPARLAATARELGPGWIALELPDDTAAASPHALLHPAFGLALIGEGPVAGAVAEIRRLLETGGMVEVHGGLPPIVYRPAPPAELSLAEVVRAAFELEPPPSLSGPPGAWAETAARILLGEAANAAQAPRPSRDAEEAPPSWPLAGAAGSSAAATASPMGLAALRPAQILATTTPSPLGAAPAEPLAAARNRRWPALLGLALGLAAGLGWLWYAARNDPAAIPSWLWPS